MKERRKEIMSSQKWKKTDHHQKAPPLKEREGIDKRKVLPAPFVCSLNDGHALKREIP